MDFTALHVGNIPVFVYSMIGLTVGAIVLSTSFDTKSDELPIPEPIATAPVLGGSKKTKRIKPKRSHSRRRHHK